MFNKYIKLPKFTNYLLRANELIIKLEVAVNDYLTLMNRLLIGLSQIHSNDNHINLMSTIEIS